MRFRKTSSIYATISSSWVRTMSSDEDLLLFFLVNNGKSDSPTVQVVLFYLSLKMRFSLGILQLRPPFQQGIGIFTWLWSSYLSWLACTGWPMYDLADFPMPLICIDNLAMPRSSCSCRIGESAPYGDRVLTGWEPP